MTPLISICIPTYEMAGQGALFLGVALRSIYAQIFRDFEVVVSDHSQDDAVERVCSEWEGRFPLTYLRNTMGRGKSSANLNHAIRHAKGRWIKPLFQDDLFYSTGALTMFSHLVQTDRWIACGCWSTDATGSIVQPLRKPRWHRRMLEGVNTLGMPSVVMFPNTGMLFDEDLIWLMDCEFYVRLRERYGKPILCDLPLILVRLWPNSVTETLATQAVRDREWQIVKQRTPRRWFWEDWG